MSRTSDIMRLDAPTLRQLFSWGAIRREDGEESWYLAIQRLYSLEREAEGDVTLEEVMMYLRYEGPAIGRLVELGDKEAIGVWDAYRSLYADRLNIEKQNELMVRVEAYIKRDLTIDEREILKNRFGHKVEPC